MFNNTDIIVLEWKGERYSFTREEFKKADVLQLPNGTMLSPRRISVETDMENPGRYKIDFGQLNPELKVLELTPIKETVLN